MLGRGGEIETRLFIIYLSAFGWRVPCGSVGGSCRMPEWSEDTRDIRWRLKGGGGDEKEGTAM
jgi:hypothetical protein